MNIFELKEMVNKIIENRKLLSSLPENEYSKRFSLKEKIVELEVKVESGIIIEDNSLKNESLNSITEFLEKYGLPKDFIKENVDETILFVSDIKFAFNGNLVSFGKKIGIDYSYVEFDENGEFSKFSSERKNELKHGIIHEFLHKCSAFKKGVPTTFMSGDAFSEGITEMLTTLIIKDSTYKSKRYNFFVDISAIFAELMGMDKLLDDYFYHIGDFPNIKSKFKEYGLEESQFDEIYIKMNRLLAIITNNGSDSEIDLLKKEIAKFLQTNFALNENEKFNELFGEYLEKSKTI